MLVPAGSTDVTTYFHLRLAADGTDATGLTITNIDLQYVRSRTAPAAKVDATALAATDSAHGDNQAIEIDSTDQPGVYRVDWPDAAFAAGVDEVILTVKVGTAFTESLRVRLMSATRGLAGTALPNAAADAAGGLPISDAGGLDLDAQIGSDIDAILVDTGTTLQGELDGIQADTEDIQSKIGTPAGVSLAADIAAIEAQTDDIGTAGAGLTAVPWNSAWDAEVQSEVQDAIEANHLDHLLAVTYDPASKPGAADALLNELVESDGGVSRFTANALEQAPTGGSAPTASEIADEVETRSLIVGTNNDKTGYGLADDAITAAKFDESTAFPVKQNDAGSTAIARTGGDADTLETLSDQLDAKASQASVDDLPTNAELATALGTADDAVLAQVALVKAKTDNLPSDPADQSAVEAAIDAAETAILAAIPTAAQNAAGLLDLSNGIETGLTPRQAFRLMVAAMAGEISGGGTTTIVIRNAVADSKDRITATVDAQGNRTAITTDLS